MLGLLTGGTGDGKTLLAVTEILADGFRKNREANALVPGTAHVPCDEKDPEFVAAKKANKAWEPLRDFRTNIKGVRIPGAVVLPLEKDWRQYRDGTVCVYDESHKQGWFRTTGKPGLSDDPVITELDEHRHRGFDIWLITQWPTKIHNEVRQLVKRHIHLVRSHGMARSMRYEWQKCINAPDEEEKVKALEGEIWEFRSEGFGWYDSSSMHTHKLEVPKAIKRALVMVPVMGLLLGGVLWGVNAWSKSKHEAKGEAAIPGAQALAAPGAAPANGGSERGSPFPPGYEWATAVALPKFKGCAALSKSCRCWNGDGAQLVLPEAKCRALAESYLPLDAFPPEGEGAAVGPGVEPGSYAESLRSGVQAQREADAPLVFGPSFDQPRTVPGSIPWDLPHVAP